MLAKLLEAMWMRGDMGEAHGKVWLCRLKLLLVIMWCMTVCAAPDKEFVANYEVLEDPLDNPMPTVLALPASPPRDSLTGPHRIPRIRHQRHLADNNPAPQSLKVVTAFDNHKPIFKDCIRYRPIVKEDQPFGTYVMTVKAVDVDPPDQGGGVTYHIVTAQNEKERFTVNPTTGEMFTKDIFDHDEPSREKEIYVTLRATDNGNPSLDDACTIRVMIEDINDNAPVFDKVAYMESVPQDLAVGREVMRISATDIDEGSNSIVQYSLDNSADSNYFYIEKDNGIIYLNKTIDKEPGYRFRLSTIVKDRGSPPLQNSINLDVLVIESNKKSPAFLLVPVDPIYVPENYNDFKTPIAVINATSNVPEENEVQFELVAGQTEQTNRCHTFVLVPVGSSAFIKLGSPMDYEKISEYTLTVRIMNSYRLAAETIITVYVTDVNDNIPVFSEIRSGSVLENEPAGTPVMQIRAIDFDATAPHNLVTYEIADPSAPFNIDSITGNITTTKMFDREEKSFYNLKVEAKDGSKSAIKKVVASDGSPSALVDDGKPNSGFQTFLIDIADKNDNKPVFTKVVYVAENIPENANINEMVTQVQAKDVDTASVITYSIVSGNINHSFMISNSTGDVRVAKELDYEQVQNYSLQVRAFDGIYEVFAEVRISLENLNDNPPVFVQNYTKTIEEERLYDGCVVQVEAYDPDNVDRSAPQRIAYSLVKQEQMKFLTITVDGCLKLLKPLDRDQPSGFARWQILVMAADQDGRIGPDTLRSTTEVILELTDINDNAPFLTNTQPVVWRENQQPGLIVTLTANDYDTPENGAPFTFALNDTLADLDTKKHFKILGNELYARDSFNREERKEYLIPISISDSGTPRMTGVSTLHVIIGDMNDNPMSSGHSDIMVYNYKPPVEPVLICRVNLNSEDCNCTTNATQGELNYTDYLDDWDYPTNYTSTSAQGELNCTDDLDVCDCPTNCTSTSAGEAPDTEIGRVLVQDLDDWDLPDKTFNWLPSYEEHNEHFDINHDTGMITMRALTPNGTYHLRFNVTEVNEPYIPFHWVEATVNVTVKEIPDEAVEKSGSIRFLNASAEKFIIAEEDGTSKQEKLHRRLSLLYNVSMDNVDIFTIANKQTVKDHFLDVRFSVHGSPYYDPVKLNTMLLGVVDKVEAELQIPVYMVPISECLIEGEMCEGSCMNILYRSRVPLPVYTNTTSFIGVTARVDTECTCGVQFAFTCFNGGTPVLDKCECPPGFSGPHCELSSIGFNGDGWAMYPGLPSCADFVINFYLSAHTRNGLIFYSGPLMRNPLLPVEDYVSLELMEGTLMLYSNHGLGSTRSNNSIVNIADGQLHRVEIIFTKNVIEMYVDNCKRSDCSSYSEPIGNRHILNINGPLLLGGSSVDLRAVGTAFSWRYVPTNLNFAGCISNLTVNNVAYNLGKPAYYKNVDISCSNNMSKAVTFGIDNSFLIAILVCVAILIILLLAVVVHRRRADAWAEKELDDIRENIIAYEDEGGGEGDAGYDLHVLRQMYDNPPPDSEGFMHPAAAYLILRKRRQRTQNLEVGYTARRDSGIEVNPPEEDSEDFGLVGAAPDISGFLDDKKELLDRDPDGVNTLDDVRHYAYEGDGCSTGSLSSLASCTDDSDLNFNYLATFGPRFRKLADIYGEDDERANNEESWC